MHVLPSSKLARVLAIAYAMVIMYVSLEPFSGWYTPPVATPFFLFQSWSRYISKFDIIINVLAYLPFGFLLALSLRPALRSRAAFLVASLIGFLLSMAMESLQMHLPTRVASSLDLICNTAGTVIGASVASSLSGYLLWGSKIYRLRYRLFFPGSYAAVGIALLALWFFAHLNPAIPLFGSTFSSPDPEAQAILQGPVYILLEAAEVLLNFIGVGLFTAMLLRTRDKARGAIILLLAATLFVKAVAAASLLKPDAFYQWLSPAVVFGLIGGFFLLQLLVHLRRSFQAYLCSVCLLTGIGITLLTPDSLDTVKPLQLFDWHYGQLLNFNGLTHSILIAWPFAVMFYLLVLKHLRAKRKLHDANHPA